MSKQDSFKEDSEMDWDENKEIGDIFLGEKERLGRTKGSIRSGQIFITECLSFFLPVSNSLQMIFGIKCALRLLITLQFIYAFIFLTSPGNSSLPLLCSGPIYGYAELE